MATTKERETEITNTFGGAKLDLFTRT